MEDTYKEYDNKEEFLESVDFNIPTNDQHLVTAKKIREVVKSCIETFWPIKKLSGNKVQDISFYCLKGYTLSGRKNIYIDTPYIDFSEFKSLTNGKTCVGFSYDVPTGHNESITFSKISDLSVEEIYGEDRYTFLTNVSEPFTSGMTVIICIPIDGSKVEFETYEIGEKKKSSVLLKIDADASIISINATALTYTSCFSISNIVPSEGEFDDGKRISVFVKHKQLTSGGINIQTINALEFMSKSQPATVTYEDNVNIKEENSLLGIYHALNNTLSSSYHEYMIEFINWNKKWYVSGVM